MTARATTLLARRPALVLALVVSCVAAGPVAAAGESGSREVLEARRWFKTGVAEVGRARWAEALPAFAASYRLRPHVITRLNIAACHRALGQYATARWWYAQVLHDQDAPRFPHLVREARDRDRELARLTATLTASPPDEGDPR